MTWRHTSVGTDTGVVVVGTRVMGGGTVVRTVVVHRDTPPGWTAGTHCNTTAGNTVITAGTTVTPQPVTTSTTAGNHQYTTAGNHSTFYLNSAKSDKFHDFLNTQTGQTVPVNTTTSHNPVTLRSLDTSQKLRHFSRILRHFLEIKTFL